METWLFALIITVIVLIFILFFLIYYWNDIVMSTANLLSTTKITDDRSSIISTMHGQIQ